MYGVTAPGLAPEPALNPYGRGTLEQGVELGA